MSEPLPDRNIPEAPQLKIEPMKITDLNDVLIIERQSFPTPWSVHAFRGELTQNVYADYVVARWGDLLVGYGGMWIVLDEAHVTNIAVHPQWRRRRFGEQLLAALKQRAIQRNCRRMTLEVRKSNLSAQKLYVKHGFVARGLRPGYYTDTNEDAIVMWNDRLAAR